VRILMHIFSYTPTLKEPFTWSSIYPEGWMWLWNFLAIFSLKIFGQRVSNQVKDVAQEAILYFIFYPGRKTHTSTGLDVDIKKICSWRHGYLLVISFENVVEIIFFKNLNLFLLKINYYFFIFWIILIC